MCFIFNFCLGPVSSIRHSQFYFILLLQRIPQNHPTGGSFIKTHVDTLSTEERAEVHSVLHLFSLCLTLPSCRNVISFLTTGKSGIIGGCMLWLLRMLRYFAMFRDGSKRSWRSLRCFSYLLGNFSQVPLRRATGARFNPLQGRNVSLAVGGIVTFQKEVKGWGIVLRIKKNFPKVNCEAGWIAGYKFITITLCCLNRTVKTRTAQDTHFKLLPK